MRELSKHKEAQTVPVYKTPDGRYVSIADMVTDPNFGKPGKKFKPIHYKPAPMSKRKRKFSELQAHLIPSKDTPASSSWRRNEDFGEGLYTNMEKYKSVSDYLQKKKRRRARLLTLLKIKKANTVCPKCQEDDISFIKTEGNNPLYYCNKCKEMILTTRRDERGDWTDQYMSNTINNTSPYNNMIDNRSFV